MVDGFNAEKCYAIKFGKNAVSPDYDYQLDINTRGIMQGERFRSNKQWQTIS